MVDNITAQSVTSPSRRARARTGRASAPEPAGITPAGSGAAASMPLVIIDEHPIVHTGLRYWIASAPLSTGVISAYLSLPDFLGADEASSEPSVIIFNPERGTQRPDYAALQQLSALKHRVIAYSRVASTEVILSCLDAGAVDYIVKNEAAHHLLDAIAAAQHGALHRGPVAVAAMHTARRHGRPELTAQERRVLVAWLLTDNKESVSQQLHISASTVRTHLHRIRRRYSELDRPAPSKAALFARALQDGLLGIDDV